MSKHIDKFRQQRLGDRRWIEKYAVGELDFNDEDSQTQKRTDDTQDHWKAFHFVKLLVSR